MISFNFSSLHYNDFEIVGFMVLCQVFGQFQIFNENCLREKKKKDEKYKKN
jgi:hypothetical protein